MAQGMITLVAYGVISLVWAGVCREPAAAANLQNAQRAAMVLAVVACLPWLLAMRTARYKLRILCFAIPAVAFSVVPMATLLFSSRAEFSSSWCAF